MLHRVSLVALALSAAPAAAQDADGAAIFEQSCAGCHAADSPLSASAMAELEQSAFVAAMEGHPDVGGVAQLTEEEVAALHAYVSEQGDG